MTAVVFIDAVGGDGLVMTVVYTSALAFPYGKFIPRSSLECQCRAIHDEAELSGAYSGYTYWESASGFCGTLAWTTQQVNVVRPEAFGSGPLSLQTLGPALGAS